MNAARTEQIAHQLRALCRRELVPDKIRVGVIEAGAYTLELLIVDGVIDVDCGTNGRAIGEGEGRLGSQERGLIRVGLDDSNRLCANIPGARGEENE
jgi:hypothetical protein